MTCSVAKMALWGQRLSLEMCAVQMGTHVSPVLRRNKPTNNKLTSLVGRGIEDIYYEDQNWG